MAYFSNGNEGMVLDGLCNTCIHSSFDAAETCPIWLIQQEFNSSQIGNKDLERCLNMLISRKRITLNIEDIECKMKPHLDKIRSVHADLPGQGRLFNEEFPK